MLFFFIALCFVRLEPLIVVVFVDFTQQETLKPAPTAEYNARFYFYDYEGKRNHYDWISVMWNRACGPSPGENVSIQIAFR